MPDRPLEDDALFDLLGNDRRRACLRYLRTAHPDATVDVAEVAECIAGHGASGDDATKRSVYATLCQTHLPKLDARDVVDYDPSDKTVTTGPAFERVCHHFDDSDGNARNRTAAIAGLAVSLVSVALLSSDLVVSFLHGQLVTIALNVAFVLATCGLLVRR